MCVCLLRLVLANNTGNTISKEPIWGGGGQYERVHSCGNYRLFLTHHTQMLHIVIYTPLLDSSHSNVTYCLHLNTTTTKLWTKRNFQNMINDMIYVILGLKVHDESRKDHLKILSAKVITVLSGQFWVNYSPQITKLPFGPSYSI